MILPVEEVETGDQLRRDDRWRLVDHIEPKLLELTILIFWADSADPDDRLAVPITQTISLWRVCRDR
jgi:hypothetical protein